MPLLSTWARAASNSGVMTAVECSSKSGPYCRHVCAGTLASEPLIATNTSVGLRTTCTIEFTAAQTITSKTVPTIIRTANGATRMARNARRPRREAERRARLPRMRVGLSAARAVIAGGMTDTHPLSSIPDRRIPRHVPTSRAPLAHDSREGACHW